MESEVKVVLTFTVRADMTDSAQFLQTRLTLAEMATNNPVGFVEWLDRAPTEVTIGIDCYNCGTFVVLGERHDCNAF